jgi:hypothetical protein
MPRRIPTEDLLNEIQRLVDELDAPPTQREMREYGKFSTRPYKNRWGSWNDALIAAGYRPNKEHAISDEDLLAEIERLGTKMGESPTTDDMRNSGKYDPSVYQGRFGSWNDAVRAAGFSPNSQVSEDDLLDEIHRLAEGEEPPTSEKMQEKGAYTPKTYHNRFGSWSNAVKTAGYTPTNAEVPEEDLLSEIHRLSNGDRPPSSQEMMTEGKYAVSTYRGRFGTWNNAIRAADYQPRNPNSVIPKEKLLSEISRLAEELGRSPSAEDMRRLGKYSIPTYQQRFHSWWVAVVKAGFKPQRRQPLCPEATHRFHKAALQQSPRAKLIGLLFQFTGITPELFANFSDDWVRDTDEDLILSIPKQYTRSEAGFWEFRLQDEWTNPYTQERESTQLPEIVLWHLDASQEERSKNTVVRDILRISQEADLFDYRRSIDYNGLGTAPRVRPVDLRITHGINLARNGAPTDFIEDRLGLNQIEQQTDVEELLIWLAEREGVNHPEYQS